MFDRGAHFEAEERRGRIKCPEGWLDPDVGWYANSVCKETSEATAR
jgi:hypothetical protein